MPDLNHLVSTIPDIVWSGLLASGLTLSGVLISNWSNGKRLEAQLRHDATEKVVARKAALRQEVCLLVIEELAAANRFLGALPQADLSRTDAMAGISGFFAAAAKLQLVAEPATALQVSKLVGEYGELFSRLLTKVVPAQLTRHQITAASKLHDQSQSEVQRLLSEVAKYVQTAQTDEAVFHALTASLKFHQAQTTRFAAERTDAWARFNVLQLQFLKDLLAELRAVSDLQVSTVVEIRRDLGLVSDLVEFRDQMRVQMRRLDASFEAMIEKLAAQGFLGQ